MKKIIRVKNGILIMIIHRSTMTYQDINFILESATIMTTIPMCVIFFLFFVIFFLQLGPYYVLDKGMGATDAIRASFESIRTNIGPAAIMTILNVVALLLGSLFFGVATLIALPFVSLFTAHLYRQFNQEPVV